MFSKQTTFTEGFIHLSRHENNLVNLVIIMLVNRETKIFQIIIKEERNCKSS